MEDKTLDIVIKEKLNLWFYYVIAFIVSAICLFVLPLFTTDIGLDFIWPDTKLAWAVYIITRLFVSAANVLIFYCFVKQARINSERDEHYRRANTLLMDLKSKERRPRSPQAYFRKLYITKVISVFVLSLLASIVLTDVILKFNMTTFVTYCATICCGIIFGILKMKDVEFFWTHEYYEYAIMISEENKNG